MLPFQPPFPTASNFPFQFEAGIHSSILISESGEGLSVAAIRQNAGRSPNAAPPPRPPPPAGAKAPAATACTDVIVVSGNLSAARPAQGAAAAESEWSASKAGMAKKNISFLIGVYLGCWWKIS